MIGAEIRGFSDSWSTPEGFARYVRELRGQASENWPRPDGYVLCTTLRWVDGARYLGRIAIRHRLNARLRITGGHLGYDVRPSVRRRGHATLMLARALPVAQALGINPALLTCDPTNLGSRAVIERARGILENCGNGQLASGYPPPQRNPDHPVDADLRPSGSPDRPQPRAAHRRKRIRTLEHVAGEQDATVREEDRGLVILTAMADARRVEMDWQAYHRLVRRACFVCELLADKPNYAHHVVHRDGVAVAFLSRFPLWPGHLLVAPATHVEDVVAVDVAQYLAVQRVVHAAGRALVAEVETERLYVLSLGSLQGNRHVHWHLVPLPPGVPYEQQQVTALAPERGHLDIPDQAQADLASRLRIRMNLDSVSGS